MALDDTHDPELASWVESANDPATDFPIQNLPFGVFRKKDSTGEPRGGVAIGDQVLDLAAVDMDTGASLNRLAAAGRPVWRELRRVLSKGLSTNAGRRKFERHLLPLKRAELFLPVQVGDYTDFYTSSFHATNVGRLLRPDNPLLPNFKWLPVGYHGRASSIVVSGTPITRPHGQTKAQETPEFRLTRRLDYEVELGFVVGPGNRLGKSIPIGRAEEHIFGVVLLNDWSARDIQAWEYQPLGPFLAKSFATTISPWIVTLEALEPFRAPAFQRPEGDPAPLPYLAGNTKTYSVNVEMHLRSTAMRKAKQPPARLSRGSLASSYWTPAQMLAHHASNGCNLRPGDILGSGTISGATPDSLGALIEITQGGKHPIELSTGERRSFLEDGDEAVLKGFCEGPGRRRIGFGEAAGTIRS